MTTYPCALGIAEPGGVWHVETLTLHWDESDPPDRATLEQEAIAAWTANNVRSEAVHIWLMEDDGWEEDDEHVLVARVPPAASRPELRVVLTTDKQNVTLMPHDVPFVAEDDEQTAMRARRRRDTLTAPDDLPF